MLLLPTEIPIVVGMVDQYHNIFHILQRVKNGNFTITNSGIKKVHGM